MGHGNGGRKCFGDRPMTSTERVRAYRERKAIKEAEAARIGVAKPKPVTRKSQAVAATHLTRDAMDDLAQSIAGFRMAPGTSRRVAKPGSLLKSPKKV